MTTPVQRACPDGLDQKAFDFYCQALVALTEAGVPFLVGGAYSFERYTGIARHTKDFDIFVRPRDCDAALRVLTDAGCRTDLTFTHWLAKAFRGDDFIDVIFSSGNGIARVDDEWFEHAVDDEVFCLPVKLCPVEETIWSKAFIMERERFDGADVAHLLRATAARLDWPRLLRRFGDYWRVLYAHLVLFGFIYPCDSAAIPQSVMKELARRLEHETASPPEADRVCRGTILSRGQYLVDVDRWSYTDARLEPAGTMTRRQIARWTAAIDEDA
jgi:hypothetical protein